MAKYYGAKVIATIPAGQHETIRAMGADHVVDYRGALEHGWHSAGDSTVARLI